MESMRETGWTDESPNFTGLGGGGAGDSGLMAAVAASLAAPFWFDILNKMMVVRSTVKPREKSQEEGSKEPQNPKPSRRNRQNRAGREEPSSTRAQLRRRSWM